MVEEDKLQLLRDILLIDDRQIADAITQRIDTISETIEKRDKLSEKIDPIIEIKLAQFVKEIPATLGPTITKTLKDQIANSKDEVVEALYPILGQMIKKYIQHEMKMLSESINKKINSTFSLISLKRKVRSRFTGVKESDLLISELNPTTIAEVFIIQKGSGILLGNYSHMETLDKDMVSGMLTAIKSFVEDAFGGKSEKLEAIEYELHTIHIQNFHTYYMAVVVDGYYTASYENELENKLLKISKKLSPKLHKLSRDSVDKLLEKSFKRMERKFIS
jgi:hypothetical protein